MALKKYPCQDVCPADAITVGRDGHLQIDQEWCISCEACMYECAIEAIYPNKYLIIQINIRWCVAKENAGRGECKYW